MERNGIAYNRINRRRALRGAAVGGAGLAAMSVLACGGDNQQPAATTQSAQPRRGGTLTAGSVGGNVNLDPHAFAAVLATYERQTYEGLLWQNHHTLEIESELAEKWEQPSQTEYIFRLRPGVKWQNKPPVSGRELTVDDVVYSLERVRTDHPAFTARTLLDGVKIEAVDKSTVKLTTTKGQDAVFLAKVASDQMMMVSREVLEKFGAVADPIKINGPESAIGTGPFMYTKIEENKFTEAVRNPDYWDAPKPYLDTLRRLRLYTSQGTEETWAAYAGGQADVIAVPANHIQEYVAKQRPGFQLEWARDFSPYQLAPNTKRKPFDDTRVTRALRLMVDHDEMIKAWMETWTGKGGLGSYLPAVLDTWDLGEEELKRNLEYQQPKDAAVREAMTFLSAAGFNRDNPLTFDISTQGGGTWLFFEAGGELYHGQLLRLGQGVVRPTLKKIVGTAYQTVRSNRDYDFFLTSNSAGYVDPDAWFSQVYLTGAGRNYWNFSNPELDALYAKQRTAFNLQERKAAVKDTLRAMLRLHPGINLAENYLINGLNPKIRDFLPEVAFEGRQYKNVWLDA